MCQTRNLDRKLIFSDVEDDRYHKAWKKSIMLVWRQIAHHKFGNVFMDKVTDEIAPGYSTCIHRLVKIDVMYFILYISI